MSDGIHTCSYHCTRPACVLSQRDELRDREDRRAKQALDRLAEIVFAQPSAEPTTECTTCGATVVRVTGVYDYPPPGEELVRAARDALVHLDELVTHSSSDGRSLQAARHASNALRRALDAGDGAGPTDTQRLDFIAQHARSDPKMNGQHVWWPTNFRHALRGPTLRDAIDNAMGDAHEAKGGGR